MRLADLLLLALANLRRNVTRTAMTTVGVLIGVAALVTLMSYGAGLQRNIRREFNGLQLFNTLRVTSQPSLLGGLSALSTPDVAADRDSLPVVPLTDSLVSVLGELPGVLAAYPEIVFPVRVRAGGRQIEAGAEAVPQAFAPLEAYRTISGSFFSSASDSAVIVSAAMARRLGYDASPGEIVGDTLTVTTATLDVARLQFALAGLAFGLTSLPIRTVDHALVVRGVLQEEESRLTGVFRLIVPLDLARRLQKLTFFSTFDLMMRRTSPGDGFGALLVQLEDREAHEEVVRSIERMGVYVVSFRDQFRELDRIFVIYDLALGVIGIIALIVATVGMANTMMMNVMERRGEIGVLKALGGEEADVRRLFLIEGALIGLMGSLAGVVFGWLVTRGINTVANLYLNRLGVSYLSLFYFAPLLLAGIICLTLAVSVLAGYAPARRAARIEPLEALKHL